MCCGASIATAIALVMMSTASSPRPIGQKISAFGTKNPGGTAGGAGRTVSSSAVLLSIFLFLLAREAEPRVRQRVEPVEVDVLAAAVALAERLRRAVDAPQRLVDVPEEAPFLAREEERLLPLHRFRALVRHVEGVAAQIAVRFLGGVLMVAELLQYALALLEQPLLEVLEHLLRHRLRLALRAALGRHDQEILVRAMRPWRPSRSRVCTAGKSAPAFSPSRISRASVSPAT